MKLILLKLTIISLLLQIVTMITITNFNKNINNVEQQINEMMKENK